MSSIVLWTLCNITVSLFVGLYLAKENEIKDKISHPSIINKIVFNFVIFMAHKINNKKLSAKYIYNIKSKSRQYGKRYYIKKYKKKPDWKQR